MADGAQKVGAQLLVFRQDRSLFALLRHPVEGEADYPIYAGRGAYGEVETARLRQGPCACARALVVGVGPGCNGALVVGEQRRGSVFGASGLIERLVERAVFGGVEDHVEF